MEAEGHDAMDIFVNIQKLSTKGEWIPITLFGEPHPGVWGKMRVSRRKQDESQAKDWLPVMSYMDIEKRSPSLSKDSTYHDNKLTVHETESL